MSEEAPRRRRRHMKNEAYDLERDATIDALRDTVATLKC